MTPLIRGALVAVAGLVVVDAAGCSADKVIFYDIVQTRTEECAIRSNGEFCVEPDQFDPPIATVWMVEYTPDISRVYVDEAAFVLDALADDADPLTAEHTGTRRTVIAENGCTTTRDETLTFTGDETALTGSYARRTVLTGPSSCGATPTGDRTLDDLLGSTTTADGFAVGP